MMNDLPASLRRPPSPRDRASLVRFGHFMAVAGPFGRMADLRRVRRIDSITVLDRRNQRLLTESAGLSSTVVRSGLDPRHFRFVRRVARDGRDPFTVFSVGIFFPHRRFEDLVRAAGILSGQGRRVRVRIAGTEAKDPGYAARIRALSSELGLDGRTEFLGAVPEQALLEEYSKADAFVFPHSPQTWGLAVFEAMACGVPTVATTGCGASEVLTDGVDSLVVPPGDPEAIARALARLMDDPSLCARLSSEGRRFVEGNIRWDLYAERMAAEMARVSGNQGADR
jgi:glycosyltransferase involved in cell wall biosynthesis